MKDIIQIILMSLFAYFGTRFVNTLEPHEFKIAAFILLPVLFIAAFIAVHFFIEFMRKGFIEAERRIQEKRNVNQTRPIRF